MEHGLVLPSTRTTRAVDFAVQAEEQGFDSVWLGELWGEHSFVQLSEIAVSTRDVHLGTAIVNVFSRTPAVLAMAAASLSRVSDERALLGVGVSTPKAIEDLHSTTYEKPVQRTKETIELVREFLQGEDEYVEYEGEIFDVSDFPPLDAPVPIYNAALGPRNRDVTGRYCDGWLPNNLPLSRLEQAYQTVAGAARAADRNPDEITVAPWIHTVVSEDISEATDAIREKIAYYVGNVDGYKNAVGEQFPQEAQAAADAWRRGNRSRANGLITDEMVAELGIAATPETIEKQVSEITDHPLVDVPLFNVPHHIDDALIETTVDHLRPDDW